MSSGTHHNLNHLISEHWTAYQILKKDKPEIVDLFFIKAYLLGRTIELILKADLITKGHTLNSLRITAGHNLGILLTLLKGNASISSVTLEGILHLNTYYMTKQYEYFDRGDVELKNISFLEEFIKLSIS